MTACGAGWDCGGRKEIFQFCEGRVAYVHAFIFAGGLHRSKHRATPVVFVWLCTFTLSGLVGLVSKESLPKNSKILKQIQNKSALHPHPPSCAGGRGGAGKQEGHKHAIAQ